MRRGIAGLVIVTLFLGLAACAKSKTSRSRAPLTESVEGLEMSSRELRIRVRALIRPVLGHVEEAAERNLRESEDPKTRRRVLVWNIEATTTLLVALLRDDPVLALADAWGYVMQVEAFIEQPGVRGRLGPFTPVAEESIARIHETLREFVSGVQEGLTGEAFEANMRQWAAENPIEGSIYRRPSIDSAVATVFATQAKGGAFAALGSLEETTEEIMTRLELYTVYMPRIARWEAELAAIDLLGDVSPEWLADEIARIPNSVDRLAVVAESAPALVAGERDAAFSAIREERIAATEDLRAERRAILAAVREERIATLAEIEAIAERLLDRQATPLRAGFREETDHLVDVVETMRLRLIDDAAVALNDVVDHAFMRSVQLLAIIAGLVLVAVVVHARLSRPRGAVRGR